MSLFQSRTTYFELRDDASLDVAIDIRSSILSDNTGGAHVQRSSDHDTTSEREFHRLLIESLDESAAMVLGEIARKAVYEVLEKKYGIERNRIPERLNELTSAFEAIFGPAPSNTIVRAIVKRLYSKLGLTFVEIPDWRLPDYVRETKARMTLYRDSTQRPLTWERLART
jgi:hypothetical protein